MDADLQDPPDLLPRMLDLFAQGYDVVSPQRISREAESRLKKWTAALFYRVISRMCRSAADAECRRLSPL